MSDRPISFAKAKVLANAFIRELAETWRPDQWQASMRVGCTPNITITIEHDGDTLSACVEVLCGAWTVKAVPNDKSSQASTRDALKRLARKRWGP